MTEDYKDILLKYITNNLSKEEGTNIPSFSPVQRTDATALYDELSDEFEYGYRQNGVVQCKNVDGEYNGFVLVYGIYWTNSQHTDSLAKGYMLLFDNNFELVQIIKQYKSGTDCGIFMKVISNNDGTLIALDHYDNRNRILLLNNPSIKLPSAQNYQLVLRTSYNLQGNVEGIDYTMTSKYYVLDKDPNSANYLIADIDADLGYHAMTQLTINVGSTNTWTNFTYNKVEEAQINVQGIIGTFTMWQDGVPEIYAYNFYTGINYNNDDVEYIYELHMGKSIDYVIYNAKIIDINEDMFGEYQEPDYSVYSGFADSAALVNIAYNNFYFVVGANLDDHTTGKNYFICNCIHWNHNTITSAYKKKVEQTVTDPGEFDLYNLNGTILMNYAFSKEIALGNELMNYMVVLITNNDDSAEILVGDPYRQTYNQFHLNTIINQFDLYKFYLLYDDLDSGWVLAHTDIIYNYLYYNGPAFENINSLRANQGMLYDVNGNIFVRGVYNHVVSDNMTEDTIQVPNTMVNDIQIIENKLMSQTNVPMVENNDTIEKNIYETLYINYFNEINMENRNTGYTISNKDGAIRVNDAISNTLDYDDMTITKYRINYSDNTSVIRSLESAIINNDVATFTFGIYTGKAIDSIDLISDDELTIYQSINATSFELNKLYTINQDCFIE